MRWQAVLLGLGVALGLGALALAVSRHSARSTTETLRVGPVVDVSNLPGAQSEVAVATDSAHPGRIVAGSNDIAGRRMRAYASSNGGRTWTTNVVPLPPRSSVCVASDPGVAIGLEGVAYYTFLGVKCRGHRMLGAAVYLASRSPDGAWRTSPNPIARAPRLVLADDRPSIAVDTGVESPHRGRLYVAWSRFRFDASSIWADPDEEQVSPVAVTALVSHSDDAGKTWSTPTSVSHLGMPLEIRLAVSREGNVYAVWRDAQTDTVYISRSDRGASFGPARLVAAAVVKPAHSCHTFRARIPAQPKRCVSPNPVVAIDNSTEHRKGSVYVVWGSTGLNDSQDVYVAAFSPELRSKIGVGHVQLVSPKEGIRGDDQFLPTTAVDSASGRLWACYYTTTRPGGARARFTCTASEDGGRSWLTQAHATTVASDESRPPANVANGYGDYESIVAAGGTLLATWTDGSRLPSRREEIMAARINVVATESSR